MKVGQKMVGLSEAEGRAVLREAFTAAGYKIVEDFDFEEDGVKVNLDGWDAAARVGYEYLTKEAHDREDFSLEEIGILHRRQRGQKLHLLLIDGEGNPDREVIEYLAEKFLRELRARDKTKA
jgi:hypothetical protein